MADWRAMELRAFRVMLVLLAFVSLGTVGTWVLFARVEQTAGAAAQASFDTYNRYVAACNGRADADLEWDLAFQAGETLQRDSRRRDVAGERAELSLIVGVVVALGLVTGFYAFRWALLGRWLPLWVGNDGGRVSSRVSSVAPSRQRKRSGALREAAGPRHHCWRRR